MAGLTTTVASVLTAVGLVAACSSSSGPVGSASPPAPATSHPTAEPSLSSAVQSVAPTPKRFVSEDYGYAVSVPKGLAPRPAYAKWDGQSELDGGSVYVDTFGQPSETRGIWAAAKPWKRNLAAYTAYTIVWNDHYHGDTCPNPPTKHRIMVGDQPAVLLAYNCGLLVNHAVVVHGGIGYWFVFVDQEVASATDRRDQATFMRMLGSVRFRR